MNNMSLEQGSTEDQPSPDTEQQENAINIKLNEHNLAEGMDEKKLNEIGSTCKTGFDQDLQSRSLWEKDLEDWTKLAMQVREPKTFPWRGASNVKYPILSTAAMQFAARAYPSLVPQNGKIVSSVVIGKDPDGQKLALADRVSTYMSYQVMHEMDDWEEDMDKLLIMLPIVGTVFKKTYWDSSKDKIKSCMVLPKNLVVDNWASSIDSAERVSEIIQMTPRILKERQLQGLFREVDLGSQVAPSTDNSRPYASIDETTPYTLIEQHTYIDLDEDEYAEPYIVTFHKETGTVLRIVARFDTDSIEQKDNKITKITPTQYYTKFSFVPNPDGSFYSIGFGVLLGPLNESVNTLINQLIDAGTLSCMQGGFIGKGLRIKAGEQGFRPGEWKPVNATSDDLRKQIVPLPAKEPSGILLQLMNALVTSGKELASIAEIFVGKMPGQNTPATTTMASIDQGMKVFTAVYKRIYRSLEQEFLKIFELNGKYLDPNTYSSVVGTTIDPKDFSDETYRICPGADPSSMTQTEKLMKAEGLKELLATGMLNPVEVIKRILDAQEQPNWQQLLTQQVQQTGQPPEPPPDPKLQEMQMKGQLEQQKVQMQGAMQQQKMDLETHSKQAQLAMQAQQNAQDMQSKAQLTNIEAAAMMHKQQVFSATEQVAMNQKLAQNEQVHQQKLHQMKEAASLHNKTSPSGGRSK